MLSGISLPCKGQPSTGSTGLDDAEQFAVRRTTPRFYQGSTVQRVQLDERSDEADRHGFKVDPKLMDGHIATQKALMHTTKRTQKRSQASPHAFSGVGMHFADASPLIIPRPFLVARRHHRARPRKTVVAVVLIGEHMRAVARKLMDMAAQGLPGRIRDDAQAHLARLASDRAQERRAIVGIGAPSALFVGPTAGRIGRITVLVTFSPAF